MAFDESSKYATKYCSLDQKMVRLIETSTKSEFQLSN